MTDCANMAQPVPSALPPIKSPFLLLSSGLYLLAVCVTVWAISSGLVTRLTETKTVHVWWLVSCTAQLWVWAGLARYSPQMVILSHRAIRRAACDKIGVCGEAKYNLAYVEMAVTFTK